MQRTNESLRAEFERVVALRQKAAMKLFTAWFPMLCGASRLRKLQALRAREEALRADLDRVAK